MAEVSCTYYDNIFHFTLSFRIICCC